MSVNVDGDTEKAVDSIIERLLAVPAHPHSKERNFALPVSLAASPLTLFMYAFFLYRCEETSRAR
jgi:hypothetical protein